MKLFTSPSKENAATSVPPTFHPEFTSKCGRKGQIKRSPIEQRSIHGVVRVSGHVSPGPAPLRPSSPPRDSDWLALRDVTHGFLKPSPRDRSAVAAVAAAGTCRRRAWSFKRRLEWLVRGDAGRVRLPEDHPAVVSRACSSRLPPCLY
ncbi:hypothetical protein VULLAG_LOCUS881 [Vulpes lagopus]